MSLQKKFLLIFIFLFLLISIVFIAILNNNSHSKKIENKRVLLDENILKIFELNMLTNELILKNNEKVKQQWKLGYNKLNKKINQFFSIYLKKDKFLIKIHEKILKSLNIVRTSFIELIQTPNNQNNKIKISNISFHSMRMLHQFLDYKERIKNVEYNINKKNDMLIIFSFLFVLSMIILLFCVFVKKISIPLKRLADDAKVIEQGKFDHKIITKDKGEIYDLGIIFNLIVKIWSL